MYSHFLNETPQSEGSPQLAEIQVQADVGLDDSIYTQNRTGRGHFTYDAKNDILVLPTPGSLPRSLSPFEQQRGRLATRAYNPSER